MAEAITEPDPARHRTDAEAFIDLEILFHQNGITRLAPTPGDEQTAAEAAQFHGNAEPEGSGRFQNLANKFPRYAHVRWIVDQLIDWADDSFNATRRRVYGIPRNFEANASREWFSRAARWKYVRVREHYKEATDQWFIHDLEVTADLDKPPPIILGSSDSERMLRNDVNGPVTEAIRLVESVGRCGKIHQPVIVLGAPGTTTNSHRGEILWIRAHARGL